MSNFNSSNDECNQDEHCLSVPDVISYKALICALATDDRGALPHEHNYLKQLLRDLLDRHWILEPPSEEERASVLGLLA